MSAPAEAPTRSAELALLRARIAALEAELAEVRARANAAAAAARARAFWLERWQLDLNALMCRPGASEVRSLLRTGRSVARLVRRTLRAVRR